MTDVAPIAFFVYNRPSHTQRAVEALQRNELAASSELFVFSDGPRAAADEEKVEEVREYLRGISGFKKVTIVERERNLGCARSIIGGITEIVNRYGRIIVVEDDIVTAPYFLRYMNEALSMYQDDDKVACINAYLYPLAARLPETFFIKGADIWGWGTWKRAWDLYEYDASKLLDQLKARNLTNALDFNGAYGFTEMLKCQIWGTIDTWDIQWHASIVLHDKLTLYPGKSLVQNIGFDSTGTHNIASKIFNVEISETPIRLQRIDLVESDPAKEAIAGFFLKMKPPIWKRLIISVINRAKAYRRLPRSAS